MPNFKVTLQANITPAHRSRRPRSEKKANPQTVTVEAPDMHAVVPILNNMLQGTQMRHGRVTAIEEVFPVVATRISDTQINKALRFDADETSALDPDEFQDSTPLYLDFGFERIIERVASALDSAGLADGLSISVISNEEGVSDFVMVEVYDEATFTYRAAGCDSRNLIEDRDLVGWPAVISVARRLLEVVDEKGLF